jgi:hypothetical protein
MPVPLIGDDAVSDVQTNQTRHNANVKQLQGLLIVLGNRPGKKGIHCIEIPQFS